MVEAFNHVFAYMNQLENNVTMREAAFMYALQRLAEAMKMRGWCG